MSYAAFRLGLQAAAVKRLQAIEAASAASGADLSITEAILHDEAGL
jgi:hypothetical protein